MKLFRRKEEDDSAATAARRTGRQESHHAGTTLTIAFIAAILLGVGLWIINTLAGAAPEALATGNATIVPAICIILLFLIFLVRHLEFGIYLILAAVMVLDQFLVFGIRSPFSQLSIQFYLNANSTTGIQSLVINPVEFLLILLVGAWFLRASITREWHLHNVPNTPVVLLFLAMLGFFMAYGLSRGGADFKAALWEIRPLYYLCVMYLLASQAIRTRRHIRICVWIIIAGLAFRGFQGCWRFFVTLGGHLGDLRAILGHEDSLFLVTGFILLAAMLFLGYRGREFKVLAWTALPNLATFIFNQRRVTYGVLVLCLGMLIALLPRQHMIRAMRYVLPAVALFAVYTAVFWNSSGMKAMPAQKIKSIFVRQEGTADDSSNEWRKMELFNLRETIRAFPQGTGFGQKYLVVIPYPDIGDLFPLWEYIPHCAIYWIWVKTGMIGFAIFWLFFGTAMVQSIVDYRAMRDPYDKAVALMIALFIAGQLIVAYYDLQITYYRNMLYLGVAMALGVAIRRVSDLETTDTAGARHGR